MIKIFSFLVFPTFISFAFVAFFPAQAHSQNLIFLYLSNLIFLSVSFVFSCVSYLLMSFYLCRFRGVYINNNSSSSINGVGFMILMPLIGICFLLYDRVFVRGIDYSQELRLARYEWLQTEGGNLFGILGNILVPVGYIGIFYAVRYASTLNKSTSMFLFLSGFIAIIGHAALNGGRSNLILLLLVACIAVLCSRYNFLSLLSKNFIKFFAPLLIVFIYVSKIIYSSANIGDVALEELLQLAILEMEATPDQDFFDHAYPDFIYVILYSLMYLFHGQWTTQILYGVDYREGFHSIVSAPTVMLDNLGFIDLGLDDRLFSGVGVFVSLPGSIYYDFGWLGIIIYAMCLGVMLGFSIYFVLHSVRIGLGKILIIFFSFSTMLFSPILPVYGFSYFSFILFSFVLVWLYSLIVSRRVMYF